MSLAAAPASTWLIEEVAWEDERAQALRADMDAEMGARYADRWEGVDEEVHRGVERALAIGPQSIVATVLVTDATGRAVSHAALRELGGELEVKRVFVSPQARGKGASRAVMAALEDIARRRGARRLILQTGDRQPDAVALYEHIGYRRIPVYPPYEAIAFSICMAKDL